MWAVRFDEGLLVKCGNYPTDEPAIVVRWRSRQNKLLHVELRYDDSHSSLGALPVQIAR